MGSGANRRCRTGRARVCRRGQRLSENGFSVTQREERGLMPAHRPERSKVTARHVRRTCATATIRHVNGDLRERRRRRACNCACLSNHDVASADELCRMSQREPRICVRRPLSPQHPDPSLRGFLFASLARLEVAHVESRSHSSGLRSHAAYVSRYGYRERCSGCHRTSRLANRN